MFAGTLSLEFCPRLEAVFLETNSTQPLIFDSTSGGCQPRLSDGDQPERQDGHQRCVGSLLSGLGLGLTWVAMTCCCLFRGCLVSCFGVCFQVVKTHNLLHRGGNGTLPLEMTQQTKLRMSIRRRLTKIQIGHPNVDNNAGWPAELAGWPALLPSFGCPIWIFVNLLLSLIHI